MKNTDVEIEEHTCATHGCGVTFWITVAYGERRRNDKKSFYCPNGHSLVYGGETGEQAATRLAREKRNMQIEKDREIARLENELRKKCRKPRKTKKV